MNEEELLNELKERFGLIPENEMFDKEELEYLEDRDRIEFLYSWDFGTFLKHYQLIKRHALEEKLLGVLAWRIQNFMSESEIQSLIESEFYNRFGNHILIKDAIWKRNI